MDEKRPTDLMAIGEFARLSQLSLKALRLYGRMGLLEPASVDEESGYRYYLPSQVEVARLIGLLRRLDMPLERIAQLLELEGGDAARAIARYWQEVEGDLQAKRRLVLYLQNELQGKGGTMFKIETRKVPEQKVATIEFRTTAAELPRHIARTMQALLEHLGRSGLQPNANPFVIYHDQVDTDGDGPVETCVPFEGALEPEGEIRVRLEPARTEMFTRITKAQVEFPAILEAYSAVHRAVAEAGKTETGAPREVYFGDWGQFAEDDPACDIAVPVSD